VGKSARNAALYNVYYNDSGMPVGMIFTGHWAVKQIIVNAAIGCYLQSNEKCISFDSVEALIQTESFMDDKTKLLYAGGNYLDG